MKEEEKIFFGLHPESDDRSHKKERDEIVAIVYEPEFPRFIFPKYFA